MSVMTGVHVSAGLAALEEEATTLAESLDALCTRWARGTGAAALTVPALLPVADLAALEVYENFPQLALVASALETTAGAEQLGPEAAAGSFGPGALQPAALALPSSACYGVYLHHRGREVTGDGRLVTVLGQCYRNEDHFDGLRRLKAFRMREVVALGTPPYVSAHFRARRKSPARELREFTRQQPSDIRKRHGRVGRWRGATLVPARTDRCGRCAERAVRGMVAGRARGTAGRAPRSDGRSGRVAPASRRRCHRGEAAPGRRPAGAPWWQECGVRDRRCRWQARASSAACACGVGGREGPHAPGGCRRGAVPKACSGPLAVVRRGRRAGVAPVGAGGSPLRCPLPRRCLRDGSACCSVVTVAPPCGRAETCPIC
ncbi:hypothetical protein ACFV3R_32595 [Streptomyces sp. NPDC059740]|uniref:hypothetical protein n=1 Tax=Streptomyces sp. NPDC059740 TaxID=3346926 RepID=UPI003667D64F